MTETKERIGTGTPIAELFDNADRIAALEANVTALERQTQHLYRLLGMSGQTQVLQDNRIARLENLQRNDLRLGDVLRRIEARLKKIEMGCDLP